MKGRRSSGGEVRRFCTGRSREKTEFVLIRTIERKNAGGRRFMRKGARKIRVGFERQTGFIRVRQDFPACHDERE
ncbi:hypothetical protein EVAR_30115_1 [Eumeta japonica]|uniref:Uncharacterized protein n=1 Tax=Eumeta variegata TaxID=151549 RepID=A0A4C1WJS0_EUMVA|nr:hypothetical protein EVAR_30115_1 [Eumeta japonica]